MTGGHVAGDRATNTGGRWAFYRDREGRAVVLIEYENHLRDASSAAEAKMRRAEISVKMELAARGEAVWESDVKALGRDDNILELRWDLNPFPSETPPVLLRLYFAEPPAFVGLLLGLHWARKLLDGDVIAEQNDSIDEARARYTLGSQWTWGVQH